MVPDQNNFLNWDSFQVEKSSGDRNNCDILELRRNLLKFGSGYYEK